ncbi:MAG: hypothetical protein U0599_05680 [Vicinamibacteria bacterium]
MPFPRVRSLSLHASYRCGDTGVCCASGWDIPVEPEAEAGIRRALAAGILLPAEALRPRAGLPHGARVVLARDAASGRCVFQEPGPKSRCAVHARLGEDALASACRQFPRVATLTPLGVSVTLSHYCPTAAALLLRPVPLSIVESPPAFPASWPFEGLDAREALPPLLRPGVLASWPALERWETKAVAVLADESLSPTAAVARIGAAAESARAWRPERGPFEAAFERALASPEPAAVAAAAAWAELDPAAGGALVAGTVPAGHPARRVRRSTPPAALVPPRARAALARRGPSRAGWRCRAAACAAPPSASRWRSPCCAPSSAGTRAGDRPTTRPSSRRCGARICCWRTSPIRRPSPTGWARARRRPRRPC